MLSSVLCTIAIIAVLLVYEDKAIPQLPYGVTLNATISVLATASKTSLLFLVGSTLSQLKWCWFQKDRRLRDMQSFDDASRGPWGSLILLWDVNWRSFASLGALITVLALAFDPFVQQVLRYPGRGTTHRLETGSVKSLQDFRLQTQESEVTGDIEVKLWSEPSLLHMAPSCPTGHCKWQDFFSFEWCTNCTDAKDSASIKCNSTGDQDLVYTCYLSFKGAVNTSKTFQPTDDSLGYKYWTAEFQSVWPIYETEAFIGEVPPAGTSTDNPWVGFNDVDVTFAGIRNPLLAMGYLTWTAWNPGSNASQIQHEIVSTEECVLTRCLKHYEVSVIHGSPVIDVVAEEFGSLKQYLWALAEHSCPNSICWAADDTQPSYNDFVSTNGGYTNATSGIYCASESCLYRTDSVEWIAQRLSGHSKQLEFSDDPLGPSYYDPAQSSLLSGNNRIIRALVAKNNSLGTLLGNVAQSLSQRERETSSVIVPGQVFTSESYVRVRWVWLILPFSLHIAGVILLLAAILSSRYHKARLWKDSLLLCLNHGMEKDERSYPTDVQGMERMAEEDIVNLDQSSSDRIMLQKRGATFIT